MITMYLEGGTIMLVITMILYISKTSLDTVYFFADAILFGGHKKKCSELTPGFVLREHSWQGAGYLMWC